MVILYLADGFEEVEAISVIDVLRRADIELQTVSIMGKKEVVGAHGICVLADMIYEDVDHTKVSMIILPGGGQGTKNLDQHGGVNIQLLKAAEQDKHIAAVCAAPTILGRLGLLKGKKATCYPGNEKFLIGADASVLGKTIVDGKIITSRGAGTSLDFALTIVAVLKGQALADTIRKALVL